MYFIELRILYCWFFLCRDFWRSELLSGNQQFRLRGSIFFFGSIVPIRIVIVLDDEEIGKKQWNVITFIFNVINLKYTDRVQYKE